MKHIVSVSGGKDSSATYCLAIERGLPFRAVAADTGNEHPATYDAVNNLARLTGGPEVEWVKADFTDRIAGKRRFIERFWEGRGVERSRIERALEVLQPTGNPFLDLCLWKGRFPSRKAQFCTTELKIKPIDETVTKPLLAAGETVVSWQGVRAAESFERSLLPKFQRIDEQFVFGGPCPGRFYVYRPMLNVTSLDEVFAIAARHGVPPNPLYAMGCGRVGCFPCINASKAEIALVDEFHQPQIIRLEAWEILVSLVCRRGATTFFNIVNDPLMQAAMWHDQAKGVAHEIRPETHGIRRMVEWAKTDRGGRQFRLFAPEGTVCSTHGACE